MLSEAKFKTPLANLDFGNDVLEHGSVQRMRLREIPFVPLTNLRVNPSLPSVREAVRRVTGLDLPLIPNTISSSADCVAMWLAPDEWLLRWYGSGQGHALALDRELNGTFHAVNELGSGYSVLELSGPFARDVLSKGCPLDLHPRSFGPLHCAQSHFFKANVLLRLSGAGDGDAWEVLVRRSFADYTAHMLLDAMLEYQ